MINSMIHEIALAYPIELKENAWLYTIKSIKVRGIIRTTLGNDERLRESHKRCNRLHD